MTLPWRDLGNMQIEHRGGNVGMPQQLFDGDDINPIFEQMGRITVPKRMKRNIFFDVRLFQTFPNDPTQAFH